MLNGRCQRGICSGAGVSLAICSAGVSMLNGRCQRGICSAAVVPGILCLLK